MIAPQPQKFTQVALLLLALVTIVNMTGMVDVLVDSDDTRISSLADEVSRGPRVVRRRTTVSRSEYSVDRSTVPEKKCGSPIMSPPEC